MLPLEGIVVADFSRILAGPLCTMLLGDAGARVIKIEEPRGDETRRWGPPFVEGESAYFLSINRNKESIAINLKTEQGRDLAHRIIARADVVVENFLPPQKKALSLTIDEIRRSNANAIVLSITGYPSDSPDSGRPGYDLLAQAEGGLMAISGDPSGAPMKTGVAIADVLTAHHAHGAILAALFERERTGIARHLEISLLASTASSLINVGQSALMTEREAVRYGNEHPSIVPYQPFETIGGVAVIAVATDPHWTSFCRNVLDDDELANDERYRTNALRVSARRELIPMLEGRLATKNRDEILRRCSAAGIPAAPVLGPLELLRDRTYVETIEHPAIGALPLVRNPVRDGSRSIRLAPPRLGEHTDIIISELGLESTIAELRADGVIV